MNNTVGYISVGFACICGSRESEVGIDTTKFADRTGARVAVWARNFFQNLQTGSGAQLAFYSICTGVFPGRKFPGARSLPPIPSDTEVNECNCTFSPHVCLRSVDAENFSCTLPTQKLRC
jgi:hypothetical protein